MTVLDGLIYFWQTKLKISGFLMTTHTRWVILKTIEKLQELKKIKGE